MEIQHNNMMIQQQQQQNNKESVFSPSSSPSHEFSFTISLLSSSTTNMAKSQQPPLAIDLTPADDIFFHGHLLPLHHLQNSPPRLSTSSLDNFTLPIREFLANQDRPHNINSCICSNCDRRPKRHSFNSYEYNTRRSYWVDHNTNMNEEEDEFPTKERVKAKTFSLFGRPRKPKQGGLKCEDQDEKLNKKKLITQFLKKYTSLFSKGRIRTEEIHVRKKANNSFSGKFTPRELGPVSNGGDSTMEELQAAVQAAIAHCKNSIEVPHKA